MHKQRSSNCFLVRGEGLRSGECGADKEGREENEASGADGEREWGRFFDIWF